MSKTKVFEIDSFVSELKTIRRFIDKPSYLEQKELFKYKNPVIAASHILRCDGKWEIWNGNGLSECNEPEIVTDVKELSIQEL